MRRLGIIRAKTLEQVSDLIGYHGDAAKILAGGTDLLYMLKEKMEGKILPVPKVLVDISGIKQLDFKRYLKGKWLEIGAMSRLSDLVNGGLPESYRVLSQAAKVIASPQIRNVATLGGNLCQRPWCWYFRSHYDCLKRGGSTCYAYYRDNREHAILEGGPCYMVHPSDMAPALVAMGAEVRISGPQGKRKIPIEEFFISPSRDMRRENILEPTEAISSLRVPEPAPGTKGIYVKSRVRGSWDFALVSVAAVLRLRGRRCLDCRIVLGGVAPLPYRSKVTEEALRRKDLSEKTIEEASKASMGGVEPLKLNGYKIGLTQGLIKQALSALVS
ncbi:MAG: FAD binding domain-containing protein [Candidatus Binatia bacterium]